MGFGHIKLSTHDYSYGKGETTPHSGVRMCQRLLVGYRLELVAICVYAMPYMKIP